VKGVLTTLNDHRLGSLDKWVIYFMGSLMAIDQKAYWHDRGNARRALSIMLSKEWRANPSLQRSYKTIGAYRKHLENAKITVKEGAPSLKK
jgi:hypothetical protein